MNRQELHRCEECGGIAEWHYVLKPFKDGLSSATGCRNDQLCWSPGQSSMEPKHVLSWDHAAPVSLPTKPIPSLWPA